MIHRRGDDGARPAGRRRDADKVQRRAVERSGAQARDAAVVGQDAGSPHHVDHGDGIAVLVTALRHSTTNSPATRVQTLHTCSRRRLRRRAALCLMQPQTLARGMRPAGRSPRGVRLRRASRSTPLPSPIRHSTTQLRRSARERGSNRGMHASGGRAPPGPGTARRSGEGHEGGDLLPAPRGQPDHARPGPLELAPREDTHQWTRKSGR